MEINMTEVVQVDAKILKVHLKVSDRFCASLESATGKTIHNQEDDYVPSFMPGEHFGDYVILDIDIDTGQITNWEKPRPEQIQKWIQPKAED